MSTLFEGLRALLVEDDPSRTLQISTMLHERGAHVRSCETYEDAIRLGSDYSEQFDIAVVDMYIPLNRDSHRDRVMRGEELAIALRSLRPAVKIVGISEYFDREPFTPFSNLFAGFINKRSLTYGKTASILFETIEGILAEGNFKKPRTFIVHGHDDRALLALKNYLQNVLHFPEPVILREQPSQGRTIIEKFEEEADRVDLVFILLTPDDVTNASQIANRRSRQNVIFELGFFYGQTRRTSGKVVLLYKGPLELPSDIQGVIYIDITKGIEAGGEAIRKEVAALGWLP